MAAVSRSRRSASGFAFIVAGALFVLAALLPMAGISLTWLGALAALATAVGFAILGFGAVNGNVAKVTLIAAAVGWAVLALGALVALPAILVTIAALVAGIGGLIGAIVVYTGKELQNTPALVFIVATILGLLYLLAFVPVSLGALAPWIELLFGIALVIAGVLFTRKEGRGR